MNVKKIMLTGVVSLLATYSLASPEPKFGAHAGLGMSNVYGYEEVDWLEISGKLGLAVGGFAMMPISPTMGLQAELEISNGGFKQSGADDFFGSLMDVSTNLTYMNVPLLFSVQPANNFSILAGPQLGVLLSSKSEMLGIEIDTDDAFNTLDFGMTVGAQYTLKDNLYIGARANFGLSPINKEQEADSDDFEEDMQASDESIKNMNFSTRIGYIF